MDVYLAFTFVVIGITIGMIASMAIRKFTHANARLLLDTSDPGRDVYKLDVFDLDVLCKKKYLEVKIVNISLK